MSAYIHLAWRALRLFTLCAVLAVAIAPLAPARLAYGRISEVPPAAGQDGELWDFPYETYLPLMLKRPHGSFKTCLVTDTAGIDDGSFNEGAWKGVQDAMSAYAVQGQYLESQQQADFAGHINTFITQGCNIIITVGFTMGNATKAAGQSHPSQKFSIVDVAYEPVVPNILGQVFATDQAAFLAGYLAAGTSATGKVATFGGIQIPTVTAYMDGFALGVIYYNQQHGTSVEVLGWDPSAQTGLFTGNFNDFDDGYTMGNTLLDEGADIIMPVAGAGGLGTAQAAKDRGSAYIIGVDIDWFYSAPAYNAIILTSVLKNSDVTTMLAIQKAADGPFAGGELTGSLANGGVGIAPFHSLAALVSAQLQGELEVVRAGIIAGTIPTHP